MRERTLTVQIMVRMPAEMLSALQDIADAEERPVSQVIRRVLRAHLDRTNA